MICVLFRRSLDTEHEFKSASQYFNVCEYRAAVPPESLVIGRYSVLPYYNELEKDLLFKGSKLINSYHDHTFIADVKNWADILDTPKTYYRAQDIPDNCGPLIVKGQTNSRKEKWDDLMFAQNKQDAISKMLRHKEDAFYHNQDIYFRQYIPLKTYLYGIGGLPVAEEYRFFVYNKKILVGGYYWSNFTEDLKEKGITTNINHVPTEWLRSQINKIDVPFYVIDVAQTLNGNWIVIELNDGQMSGLSIIDCDNFYRSLYENVKWC